MSEIEEIKEIMRESGAKPPRRKIGKRGKIAIVATLVVIAILIGVYVALLLTAPPPEKYWKPQKEFAMPEVDWNAISSRYVLQRGNDGIIHHIGKIIGSIKIQNFKMVFLINITNYAADTDGTGGLDLVVYLYSQKREDVNYQIKSLEFKFDYGNDSNVSYLSITWSRLAAKNLYFDVTPGKYSGPWGTYDNKLDYEWMDNFRITGVNKDGNDIKEAGFSFPMKLAFFDKYPHWYNHTITFTAILEYGKYVQGWLGSGWQDVHRLSTSVEIYIVPQGGE